MDGSYDIGGKPPVQSSRTLRGCGLGCLLPVAGFFALFLVFGAGLGFPYTYWLQISEIQAFEGEESVVLFIEVERTMRYGGFMQEAPINKTMKLIRVDISRVGQVSQVPLKFDDDTTFNTNIAPIIKLPDHFYLVQGPSLGRPACQLHRVLGDRIESLSIGESDKILESICLPCGRSRRLDDFSEFDAISERSGWTRLNGSSYGFRYGGNPIVSARHKLRLRLVDDGVSQAIVAESFDGPNHWSKPLVSVDTTRWKSYRSPMR